MVERQAKILTSCMISSYFTETTKEINMKKEILEQMKSEEFSIKDLTDFYETLKGRLVHNTYSGKETNRIWVPHWIRKRHLQWCSKRYILWWIMGVGGDMWGAGIDPAFMYSRRDQNICSSASIVIV